MDEDGFLPLAQARIAIIGLGLMGGSLALALKGKCANLIGIDRNRATLELARHEQIVDQASDDAGALLNEASVIILATPVKTILRLIEQIPDWHPEGAIVLDLGSTKSAICRALAALPDRFDPIGGHPMCGREKSGLVHASAGLYRNAPFALTALERTSPQARSLGVELVAAVGAIPLWLDAETHDRWAAATSHLPYLVASALVLGTPAETAPLLGPGFHSTTRVAATNPTMMMDILQTNPAETLAALKRFKKQLAQIEADLHAGDWESLNARLESAAALRQQFAALPA